jgi:D-alanyl-D-alanine carboxypeptidase
MFIVPSFQYIFGQQKADYIKQLVSETRKKFGLPALAVVTLNSSEIKSAAIQGTRIWNTKDTVSLDNFFHIGSCSKSILTIVAAKLIEEAKLSWDTKFFSLYPELIASSRPDYVDITLQDIILCKAGIQPFTSGNEKLPAILNNSSHPRYEFTKWLICQTPSAKKLHTKFEFQYSNAGYTIASLMLEKASGLKFEELVEKYIVNEMGVEIVWGFPNKRDSLQPWGHTIIAKEVEVFPPSHEYIIPNLLVPAGDLSMKPLGFAKYIQHHLKGLLNTDNFLSSENYRYIHYAEKGFSLGVYTTKQFGINLSGMDGSAGTFFCRAIIIPQNDFAFIIMTNAGTGTAHMKAIDWLSRKIAKKQFNWWWKFWM